MAQPSFVPITEADQVRLTTAQPHPTWVAGRPSEERHPAVRSGAGFGSPGPDQGFAIKLAHRMKGRLVLETGEDTHDVEIGVALVASRRASHFGRAPSIYDIEVALGIFGFLAPAPPELVEHRRSLFQAVGHSWEAQRALVDSVPAAALLLSPEQAAAGSSEDWRAVLGV
jgi:hypothetical protein